MVVEEGGSGVGRVRMCNGLCGVQCVLHAVWCDAIFATSVGDIMGRPYTFAKVLTHVLTILSKEQVPSGRVCLPSQYDELRIAQSHNSVWWCVRVPYLNESLRKGGL